MYSKKKHNVNYIKPSEPAFITKLKQQAGYVEGPTVETKKEELSKIADEDFEDRIDEKPVVVVMKDGDLTSEEADLYAAIKKQVAVIGKADLSQKVIFKRKKGTTDESSSKSTLPKDFKKKKKDKPAKTVLSFSTEDEENY